MFRRSSMRKGTKMKEMLEVNKSEQKHPEEAGVHGGLWAICMESKPGRNPDLYWLFFLEGLFSYRLERAAENAVFLVGTSFAKDIIVRRFANDIFTWRHLYFCWPCNRALWAPRSISRKFWTFHDNCQKRMDTKILFCNATYLHEWGTYGQMRNMDYQEVVLRVLACPFFGSYK